MSTESTNQQIPGLGVHHVAVETYDREATMRLYRDVLGMKQVAEFGTPERRLILMDAGDGTNIEIFVLQGSAPKIERQHPLIHIAMRTTDTDAATEKVRAAGYTITVEPKVVDLGPFSVRISFFNGPNGESIEFLQELR